MSKESKKADRILYISDFVPPFLSGPSVLIHRLLRHFPDDSYVFLTSSLDKGVLEERIDEGLRLPAHYVYALNSRLWKFLSKLQFISTKWKWLEVPAILLTGLQVVREKMVKYLLVVPTVSPGTFLLATCWLHRITGIPMSIYFFDMFDRGRRENWEYRTLSSIERWAVQMASNVFVMSEPLQEHYGEKYGINPILLPHPVDVSSYNCPCDVQKGAVNQSDGLWKIAFTGMIYESQLDAILNLVNVVNGLPNVEFHVYAPITEAKRRWMGINGPHVIFHGRVSHKEIPAILQNADILFLPMAFDYVYPHMVNTIPPDKLRVQRAAGREIIKTAAPSKLPEYLAAGRPILIHAPEYSYVAWYGKTHQCAEVVNQPELGMLRRAILRLRSDQRYCDYLVANARRAAEQHDVARVSKLLQQYLGIATPELER